MKIVFEFDALIASEYEFLLECKNLNVDVTRAIQEGISRALKAIDLSVPFDSTFVVGYINATRCRGAFKLSDAVSVSFVFSPELSEKIAKAREEQTTENQTT